MATSSISDWSDMMGDTLTVAEATIDEYGKPTYGSPVTYNCRVVFKDEWTKNSEGREVLAKGTAWIQGATAISVDEQVTLSDGTNPFIISSELYEDEVGNHHAKIMFG